MPSLCSHSLMLHGLLNSYNLFLRGIRSRDSIVQVLGKHILFPLKNLRNSPPLSWSTSLTSHPTSFLQALLSRRVSFHLLLELSRQALASASLSPLNVFPHLFDQPCHLLSFCSVLWDPHSGRPPQLSSIIASLAFLILISFLHYTVFFDSINVIYHVEYKFTGQEL